MADDYPNQNGGEWQLLTTKFGDWVNSDAPQTLWQQLQSPLKALSLMLGGLFVLRLYSGVLGALESFPLLPGLLQLIGLVWIGRYSAPVLLRSDGREALMDLLNKRWQRLRNGGEGPPAT